MANHTVPTLGPDLGRLTRDLTGDVVTSDHPDYDIARAVWNGSIDRRPVAVVRCRTVDDIAAGLAFGIEHDLAVAVRGGGHNVAGFGTCDDGIVLDLRGMATVDVDPEARTATIGPGVVGHELDRATQVHGLATTTGVMSTTGVTGLTLGGGIGWLQRAHGLACDNVLSAEMLTADGRVVRASDDENPELFWGLRGGGGNFGIVTSLTLRLHEVGPEVVSGLVAWRAADAPAVFRAYRDFVAEADDELMAVALARTAPPAPFLPEQVHGQPIVAIAVCHAGSIAEGERAVADIRRVGEPVGDAIAVRPYADFQAMFDGSWAPGLQNYWKAEYLSGLEDDLIEVLARYATSHTSPMSDFKVAAMGGAVARVDEHATATSHRDAAFVLNINTRWSDPAETDVHVQHTRALFEESTPYSAGGVYVNFLGDEGGTRVAHAYDPVTFARLQDLKSTWDPGNVLRVNQNIPPRIG